jgi:hypothetical protein
MQAPPLRDEMHFKPVEDGAPPEGALLLVRLSDDSYVGGRVAQGFFTVFNEAQSEWVQFAHPERITHWMVVIPPVPRGRPHLESVKAEDEADAKLSEVPDAPDDKSEDVFA